jgi:hypothetical protein
MHLLRKSAVFLCLLALLGAGALFIQFQSPAVAHASTSCYASSCKNLDPTTTVGPDGHTCFSESYVQETAYSGNGYVQNVWSANCDANWSVGQAPSSNTLAFVYAEVCYGTASGYTCNGSVQYATEHTSGYGCLTPIYFCTQNIPSGTTHWYTNMVDGSHPVLSGVAFIPAGNGSPTKFH